MSEHNKILPRPIFRRDVSWEPFPNWTNPGRIFTQDFGLPPFLDRRDLDWVDWAHKRLASFSWPVYAQNPPLLPVFGTKDVRRPRGTTEVRTDQHGSWRIQLDVNHFRPEEITIITKDGNLQISGNHKEKQDDHGFVSRSFTRKYKLPQGLDLQQITCSMSATGLLSVEALLPGSSISASAAEVVLPVQIQHTEPEMVIPVQTQQTQHAEKPAEEEEPKAQEFGGGDIPEDCV